MNKTLNISRVLEPQQVLPTSAWRLDNNRNIYPNELRMSIKKIHLEGTSFKQIRTEANDNEEQIKQKIIDIVIRRGKLHNPVTDTGGLAFGVIEQIGAEFDNPHGFKVGDEILCNASLASVPMHIERIHRIDPVFHQIEADGYMIINSQISLVRKEEGVPENLLMFAFDESGTLYRLHQMVEDPSRRKFLIVGNSLITNILYGYVIRRSAGPDAEIVCIFDKRTDLHITGGEIDQLMNLVFSEIHYMDILKPLECMKRLERDSYFDMTINCAEIPGAETINILAAKWGGTVLFTNLINNLNIALYITESLTKPLKIREAEGYLDGYDVYDVEIVRELAPYFENARFELVEKLDNVGPDMDYMAFGRGEEVAMQEDYVYRSRAMKQVLEEMMRVSKYDCNVIIFGDTGVGKEKAANIIQKNSDRKMQPFIKINCASIAPNLIESEFFGYEKGAFTGASATGKKGYFETANNGVIFLDEIGELPLEMQAKLLRVIQDGEFYRVGGTTPIKTNVRILSATNRDLEDWIEKGLFRRDLYYRLNVVPIRIPCLTDRPEDIPALVGHFLKKYGKKFGRRRGIDDAAMEYLQQQPWPGNIRELENTVQRLIISAKGDTISLMDVMRDSHGEIFHGTNTQLLELTGDENEYMPQQELDLQLAVDEYEKGLIRYACEKYGSTRKAAKALGISQTQIVRKKKKYDIP